MITAIQQVMRYETAGDPMTGLKWTHRTTEKIAQELAMVGIQVSRNTVGRLLKTMGFSLRVNHKSLASVSCEDRDAQFAHIHRSREDFTQTREPIISVDTKKKELVGNFKNPGVAWRDEPIRVKDHDFRSEAEGLAVPYGIYDLQANRGYVCVGNSRDTPEFAVDAIETWWQHKGKSRYPHAQRLLILADSGGSNSARSRLWKARLQEQLADRHRLSVTVGHYPAGTSKWNPIEHRLFSAISKNWAGRPLDSFETIVNYIRTTTTTTGLRVEARRLHKSYEKGVKVSDKEMRALSITTDDTLPKGNYTITPRCR